MSFCVLHSLHCESEREEAEEEGRQMGDHTAGVTVTGKLHESEWVDQKDSVCLPLGPMNPCVMPDFRCAGPL